jgi:hypothetical protein
LPPAAGNGICLAIRQPFCSNTRVGILTATERAFVLAIVPRFVPDAAGLAPGEAHDLLALVDEALGERSPSLRRQFSLLLSVLRWSPIARFGRPLDRLGPDAQDAVLRWFQNAPLQKLRGGFWGLRTLIYLGYYGRPAVAANIAYHPSRDGNALLHDRTRR